jgi:imidazolonepropionase-like amidohydrolase
VKHKAFMVPTLVTYEALSDEESQAPEERTAKLNEVKDRGQTALALAHQHGVKLAYGTDLLGAAHAEQLREFALRARVQKPADVIRSATCTAAELFNETGHTGVVAAGARADLLVVDGDPLRDLGCLQDPERRLKAIMKGGVFYKNTLQPSRRS